MSKYSLHCFVFNLIVLVFLIEDEKRIAQITFMHSTLHILCFCSLSIPVPALLYNYCLMNTATVCTYVYQVILDVCLILLWECSVVDIVSFLDIMCTVVQIMFCLQTLSSKPSPAKQFMRTKWALRDQPLTTFTKHLFSLKLPQKMFYVY